MPSSDGDERNQCIDRLVADGVARGDIQTLFVPGRVELLGKHTDYCGGRSVTCAVDRGFHVAFAPASDPEISMTALDLNERRHFAFSADLTPTPGTWSNYPMSVARRLARNFAGPLRGANIALSSTLPQAAGMSSSSALVVATFLVLDAINSFAARANEAGIFVTPFELAEYLGTLENGQSYRTLAGDAGVGTFGGSEDHTAITLARKGQLGVYRYSPTRLETEVALPDGYVLAIATSGIVAEKTGAARERYNRSSLLVSELVKLWNDHQYPRVRNLAAITRHHPDAAEKLRSLVREHVPDPLQAIALLRRLEHFEFESESVIPLAIDALTSGDLARFGGEVDRSQEAAHRLLQNQIPETQLLARAARRAGAVAASSFGAGFGGSVWAMIPRDDVEAFLPTWHALYATAYPAAAADSIFFKTSLSDGTHAQRNPLVAAV